MGNAKKGGRAKKRRFCGNRYTSSGTTACDNSSETNSLPIIDSPAASSSSETVNSSAKKIKLIDRSEQSMESSDSVKDQDGFILMDLSLLFDFLTKNMTCPECKHYSVSCELNKSGKKGFAHEICFKCTNCPDWTTKLNSSKSVSDCKSSYQDVNVRMVSFVRSLGRGHSALQNFSLHLNSPPPMTKANYMKTFKTIHSASHAVATESMQNAANEIQIKAVDNDRSRSELSTTECAVSVDGTWQRRGHASHHGVVTAISVATGKCVDTEVLSNACKGCKQWESKKGTEEFEKWRLTHNCRINHVGSAGAMEAAGALNIFKRSTATNNLQYTQYLGDGDSASFKKVSEANVYAGKNIVKLECVGHVQKRVGTRLRRLVSENKGRKLDDGRGIGGVGRLTNKKIDTLQNYYGFAIRNNAGNLAQMEADIRAVPYHVASTVKNPMHQFCPEDSWCKFKTDPDNYKHKNGLPETILNFILPVFKDLSDEALLKKCLHGKTQNNNECLNKLIWDRCSKEYYVEKDAVEQAVFSAVSYFNDGAISLIKFYEKFGLAGTYTAAACTAKDFERVEQSARKCSEKAKKRRKTIRAIKKGFQDATDAKEGDMYTAGGH